MTSSLDTLIACMEAYLLQAGTAHVHRTMHAQSSAILLILSSLVKLRGCAKGGSSLFDQHLLESMLFLVHVFDSRSITVAVPPSGTLPLFANHPPRLPFVVNRNLTFTSLIMILKVPCCSTSMCTSELGNEYLVNALK